MGLPPTPVSARPAACTPGPLCPSYICVHIFLFPLPGPFILCLSPSHSPPAFPPSSSHEGEKEKKKEINLSPPRLPPSSSTSSHFCITLCLPLLLFFPHCYFASHSDLLGGCRTIDIASVPRAAFYEPPGPSPTSSRVPRKC